MLCAVKTEMISPNGIWPARLLKRMKKNSVQRNGRTVGVLLERRADDLDAEELEIGLEEVPRAARRVGLPAAEQHGKISSIRMPPPTAISIWLSGNGPMSGVSLMRAADVSIGTAGRGS
jgi:hypothetical protein